MVLPSKKLNQEYAQRKSVCGKHTIHPGTANTADEITLGKHAMYTTFNPTFI